MYTNGNVPPPYPTLSHYLTTYKDQLLATCLTELRSNNVVILQDIRGQPIPATVLSAQLTLLHRELDEVLTDYIVAKYVDGPESRGAIAQTVPTQIPVWSRLLVVLMGRCREVVIQSGFILDEEALPTGVSTRGEPMRSAADVRFRQLHDDPWSRRAPRGNQ